MPFNNMQAKSVLQSVTFWGAVLTAVATAIPTTAAKFGLTTHNTAVLAQYIVQGMGFLITVYGRLRASQPVTLTGK